MGALAFHAELWEHSGEGSWHFVTLPVELSADIRERAVRDRNGLAAGDRVSVTIRLVESPAG